MRLTMFHKQYAWRATGIVLTVLWGFAPSLAFAQSETDVGEVAGLGGVAFAGGGKPVLAGSSGFAFSRYAMAVFDTSFMTLGNHTIQSWPERSTVEHSY